RLAELKDLELSSRGGVTDALTEGALKVLSNMKSLQRLSIDGLPVRAELIRSLSSQDIEALSLYGTATTWRDLQELSAWHKLKELGLGELTEQNPSNPVTLTSLAALTNLT